MALMSASEAQTNVPTSRNGKLKSQTIGKTTRAKMARGQLTTNRISQQARAINVFILIRVYRIHCSGSMAIGGCLRSHRFQAASNSC